MYLTKIEKGYGYTQSYILARSELIRIRHVGSEVISRVWYFRALSFPSFRGGCLGSRTHPRFSWLLSTLLLHWWCLPYRSRRILACWPGRMLRQSGGYTLFSLCILLFLLPGSDLWGDRQQCCVVCCILSAFGMHYALPKCYLGCSVRRLRLDQLSLPDLLAVQDWVLSLRLGDSFVPLWSLSSTDIHRWKSRGFLVWYSFWNRTMF